RNPRCRFDHRTWTIEPRRGRPEQITLAAALDWCGANSNGEVCLYVEGATFLRRLVCAACGGRRDGVWCLDHRLPRDSKRCPACGETLVAGGFDRVERLHAAMLTEHDRQRTLAEAGLKERDVITVKGAEAERHFEI
ncbi:MAG: hypothetical protein ACREJB_11285, partial [Planctomycetaceae bacterium]